MTDHRETEIPMAAPDEAPGWFDRASNIKKLLWALYVACAVSVVLEVVMRAGHIGHFEKMTGLYAMAGLLGGVVLVFVARDFLSRIVRRPEDYYDD